MNRRGEAEGSLKATNDVHGSCSQQRDAQECHQIQPTKMIVLSANKAKRTKSVSYFCGLNKDHKGIVLNDQPRLECVNSSWDLANLHYQQAFFY